MRAKLEASEKKPDRLMRKGVGIVVFFTGWEYNVCEKIKYTPTAFLKIRHPYTFT